MSLTTHLASLYEKHHILEQKIQQCVRYANSSEVIKLKKQKLMLKDQISQTEKEVEENEQEEMQETA